MKVMITGASRGIGLALVEKALAQTFKVFAVTRTGFNFEHKNLEILKVDITQPAGVALIKNHPGLNEGLDILINNAGVMLAKKSDEESAGTFAESFHLNAATPFLLTQAVLPALKKSKSPKVIQISTMMSSIQDNTSGGYYSYRSSKMALNMITQSLSLDFPDIAFGLLHPGWVKTEMGGPNAPLTVEKSAEGLWQVIHELKTGLPLKLMDFRGRGLPW